MAEGGAGRRPGRVTAVVALAAAVLAACSGGAGTTPADETEVSGVAVVPTGRVAMVEVDGRQLATRCAGESGGEAPPVVLVAGHGWDMARSWDPVQGRIGEFTRVCAYDRLGVGGSSKPPKSQTYADMATQLDGVVEELGLDRPVVLVAHSLGGYVAAAFAEANPDDVAGLLLLDAPGPGYPQAVLDILPNKKGRAGAKERDGWEALLRPKSNAERLDGRAAFEAAAAYSPLGDVPLVALSHTIPVHPDSTKPRQQADLESAWEEGQQRWLALSSQATLERVDLAGPDIQRDQPDVVVDRARELVR